MVIKTKKGYFEVIKNVKDALDITKFEECYIEEWYDQFNYIVGDISDSKLRLKGFYNSNSKKCNDINNIENLDSYIKNNCAFDCKYFVAKRI